MALQRSKSAPHTLPALVQATVPRTSSFHTLQKHVRAATGAQLPPPEDPFSLSGFFPSLRRERWGWLREETKLEDGDSDVAEEDDGVGALFGDSDEQTQEAIRDEDKLGVLSFGKLFRGRREGERLLSMYGQGEAVDMESLYQSMRVERGEETGRLDGEWGKTGVESVIEGYFPVWEVTGYSGSAGVEKDGWSHDC